MNAYVPSENGLEMCMDSNRSYHTAQRKHLYANALQHCFPKPGMSNNPLVNFATLFLQSNLADTKLIVICLHRSSIVFSLGQDH